MSDVFDRPNRATGPREVWERKSDGACFFYEEQSDGNHIYRSKTGWGFISHLPADTYRIRTLDEVAWPEVPRVEKRRVVTFTRVDGMGYSRTYFETLDSGATFSDKAVMISDEIRDCEVSATGEVIRVLPQQT